MDTANLFTLAAQLHEAIENDARVQCLRQAEQALDQDIQVLALAAAMQECALVYQNDELAESARSRTQRELHLLKKQLDEHPLVMAYHQAFRPVRLMYENIQRDMFTPFNLHFCEDHR